MTGFIYTVGTGQRLGIDTNEIESLIDEWNFANNTRNVHSFEKVYGEELTFYTERLSRRRAIAQKEQLFKRNPNFRQRIVTEISYKPFSKGVIKCDFTKEVFERNRWKKYRSYLLVSYQNNHYSIVGESDYATDRVLKYKPDLGEPIAFQKETEQTDTVENDSVLTAAKPVEPVPVSEAPALRDTVVTAFTLDDLLVIFSDSSAFGVVTVPRGYIYILIGILALGGLLIVIADSTRKPKRRPGRMSAQHAEAEHVVRDFKVQSGFEAFVITLFDPLFFRYKRFKNEHVYAGKQTSAEKGPDFVFDFNQKEVQASFAIKCQYYRNIAKNEVQLFTDERQRLLRQFEEDRDIDVYYVLGFGGTPDDPKELFFVPAKDVEGEYITKAALRQYSKSGMFYYNKATGRIQ